MKNRKLLIVAIAGFVSMSSFAFAGDPKTQVKNDNAAISTVVPAASAANPGNEKMTFNVYYVNAIDGTDNTLYDISTSPNPACGTTPLQSPCEIHTTQTLGSTVSRNDVDNQVGITIATKQPQL